ncbi:hypothetical protein HPB47_009810 [Ixodes persulcatus]|uniref:Uncharacterized protein n=1 Tax=Ixodes persulcatus TaxID=34615 RepID=A0AC60P151_IXOPE|nr:hypothetical protein HPB47_009810 [Ixodes persulcatus]
MPKDLKAQELAKGECKTSMSHGIMAIQWQDRKPVTMFSTSHGAANITDTGKRRQRGNEPVQKPLVVQEYNRGMGGVDRQDQQLASFPIMCRYAKGYKIFFHVLDMAVYKAYVLHATKTGKQGSYHTDWKVDLSEETIAETALPRYQRLGKQPVGPSPMRLEAQSGHTSPIRFRRIPSSITHQGIAKCAGHKLVLRSETPIHEQRELRRAIFNDRILNIDIFVPRR